MKMHYDVVTTVFFDLLPFLQAIPDSSLNDAGIWIAYHYFSSSNVSTGKSWKAKLIAWDGNELTGSTEATVFEYWYVEMLNALPALIWFRLYELGKLESETGYVSWIIPYFILNTLENGTSPVCGGSCIDYAAKAFTKYVLLHFVLFSYDNTAHSLQLAETFRIGARNINLPSNTQLWALPRLLVCSTGLNLTAEIHGQSMSDLVQTYANSYASMHLF